MKRWMSLLAVGAGLAATNASAATILTFFDRDDWLNAACGACVTSDATATFTSTFSPSVLLSPAAQTSDRFIGGGVWNDLVTAGGTITAFAWNDGNFIAAGGIFNLGPGGAGSGLYVGINFAGGGFDEFILDALEDSDFLQPFFFGFVGDEEISSIQFRTFNKTVNGQLYATQERYTLDNLEFVSGEAAPPPPGDIPEPSTFGLMGIALAGLGLAGRRFRRS